jgi:hypothetical protein
MAHNDQASGSRGGGGYARPTNLNNEEAQILADNNILVPPLWHLPHGWHVSIGRYTIAPILPEGPLLDDHIEHRWKALPPAQRDLPEWAPTRVWLPILQNKRELKIARFFGPHHGRYNMTDRRAYWRTRDIDTVLREHGYQPERRASSLARGWTRSAPTPPARSSSRSSNTFLLNTNLIQKFKTYL